MNQLQSATRSGPKSKLWVQRPRSRPNCLRVQHRASFIILTALQVPWFLLATGHFPKKSWQEKLQTLDLSKLMIRWSFRSLLNWLQISRFVSRNELAEKWMVKMINCHALIITKDRSFYRWTKTDFARKKEKKLQSMTWTINHCHLGQKRNRIESNQIVIFWLDIEQEHQHQHWARIPK